MKIDETVFIGAGYQDTLAGTVSESGSIQRRPFPAGRRQLPSAPAVDYGTL